MNKAFFVLSAIAAIGITAPAAAQNINQRQSHQEQRIRQGGRTGELTPRETRRLQFLEARLRRTEARMRARHGGHLSRRERQRLREMERRDSAAIYRLKHNRRAY